MTTPSDPTTRSAEGAQGAAQQLAERVASTMFANDRASQALGMRIASVSPGRAELTMIVRDDMLNGHAICHGGFIFLLADSTFAFACNSYNRNTVAQGCSIEYLAPAHGGDVLHNLAAHYGEDRYRLSPLIARRYATGQCLAAPAPSR